MFSELTGGRRKIAGLSGFGGDGGAAASLGAAVPDSRVLSCTTGVQLFPTGWISVGAGTVGCAASASASARTLHATLLATQPRSAADAGAEPPTLAPKPPAIMSAAELTATHRGL